jgi:hypothetical protein
MLKGQKDVRGVRRRESVKRKAESKEQEAQGAELRAHKIKSIDGTKHKCPQCPA